MSKKPNSKREIIPLDEVPRSGTPESASKRQRTSRSTSKAPVPDSSRSDESGVREIRGVKASKAGATESSSIVRPARTLAATLCSDQPDSVAMAHLSVARSSMDPADHRTSGEADAEARPGMSAIASTDPSDHRTSGEADAEARPAMSAITSMDPSDHRTSGEADTEARPAMSAMRSRTPADYLASTGVGTAASLVMSTLRSVTPSVNQASTETSHEASLVLSTRASGRSGLEGDW